MADPYIRWMIRRDMAAVLRIESRSFEFPWNDDDFVAALRRRNCIGMVAEHENRIVGHMIYDLEPNRLRLLNIAVCPDHRRTGIGSQLVQRLVSKLSIMRRDSLAFEVRESNVGASCSSGRSAFESFRLSATTTPTRTRTPTRS
ncbi:MAG TPA: ribosomal-protein-alanine N-acetyltransferase RimI [Planctomycetaceae bacterium]|nr:ribosomal-protein-alanine N-acetyltransferase RimI [Planctomycetaceae bacterium]HRF02182.1 GNAT family N-acetyltransferase [Pirellulaceae bacterium]